MKRDIVVIGASAGGVETLQNLVGLLPSDFAATILIAQHIAPHSVSVLPQILTRAGTLEAVHAMSGEPLLKRRIYIAPPNRHLMIRDGRIDVTVGPRENNHRPAIDTLFRSAALAGGARVIGVILTGMLGDGVSGLAAIKARGGMAIVQDLEEAPFRTLPKNAIDNVEVDHVARVREIADLLIAEVGREVPMSDEQENEGYIRKLEVDVEAEIFPGNPSGSGEEEGSPSVFTCPDCHGTLFEINDAGLVRFRCRVGHSFSMEALSQSQAIQLEDALYSAMKALEEHRSLMIRMAARSRNMGHPELAIRHEELAAESGSRAKVISQVISDQLRLLTDDVVQ